MHGNLHLGTPPPNILPRYLYEILSTFQLPGEDQLKDCESLIPALFSAFSTSLAEGLPVSAEGTCKVSPLGIFPIDFVAVSLYKDIFIKN